MIVYYYFHVPKTGGTSMVHFFKHLTKKLPKSILYNFDGKEADPQYIQRLDINPPLNCRWCSKRSNVFNIKLKKILLRNTNKYEYIFIHHHHGYRGLMNYKDILLNIKQTLETKGHSMKIFTTIRDVVSFNNSRLNYGIRLGYQRTKEDFLNSNAMFNHQTKYLFYGQLILQQNKPNITKKQIDDLEKLIDIFIETKNITSFMDTLTNKLNISYNSTHKKNVTKHKITLDNRKPTLLKNNYLDAYLLEKYITEKSQQFNL
jgi:hypothetical protein